MIEITFSFRPMPNLDAPLCVGTISIHREFVEINAIKGHPMFVTGPVAHILSGAFRDARNELRNAEVLK